MNEWPTVVWIVIWSGVCFYIGGAWERHTQQWAEIEDLNQRDTWHNDRGDE